MTQGGLLNSGRAADKSFAVLCGLAENHAPNEQTDWVERPVICPDATLGRALYMGAILRPEIVTR